MANSDTWTYNPTQMTREELLGTLVGRDKLLDELVEHCRISQASVEPTKHVLLHGARGSGKTSVLRALGYRLEDDKALASRLIPIAFREEENSITGVHSFLARVVELCPDQQGWPPEDFRRLPSKVLLAALEQRAGSARTFLLLPENLGDLLDRILDHEKPELRELFVSLFSHPRFLFVATALVPLAKQKGAKGKVLKRLAQRFEPRALDGLGSLCTDVIQRRARWDDREDMLDLPGVADQIRAVATLSAGLPRYIVELYGTLRKPGVEDVEEKFKQFLNQVTATQQGLLGALTVNARATLEAIVRQRGMATVSEVVQQLATPDDTDKEIAKRVRHAIKELQQTGFLLEGKRSGREKTYEIQPPVFQLWYEMRYLDPSQQRLWLLRFFESGIVPDKMARQHVDGIKSSMKEAGENNNADLLQAGLQDLMFYSHLLPDEEVDTVLDEEVERLLNTGQWRKAADLCARAKSNALGLGKNELAVKLAGQQARCLEWGGHLDQAISFMSEVSSIVAPDQFPITTIYWHLNKAELQLLNSNPKSVRSEVGSAEAIIKTLSDDSKALRTRAAAKTIYAACDNMEGRHHDAIMAHAQALTLFKKLGHRDGERRALYLLGNVFRDLGDHHKSIEMYQRSLLISSKQRERSQEAASHWRIAFALIQLKNYKDALTHAEQAQSIFNLIGRRCYSEDLNAILATIHAGLGNGERSLEYLQKTIDDGTLSPKNGMYRFELGITLLKAAGNWSDATHHSRIALEMALASGDDVIIERAANRLVGTLLQLALKTENGLPRQAIASALAGVRDPAAHLPDPDLATLLLQQLFRPLLREQGMAAREQAADAINQIATWGRPEVARRLAPISSALACADVPAWLEKRDSLPPGEREAAQQIWDLMNAGHELAVAEIMLQQGDTQDALNAADRFHYNHPGDVRGLRLALKACHKLGDQGAALTRSAKAVGQAPDSAEHRALYIDQLLRGAQYEEALEQARQLVKMAPSAINSHATEAYILLQLRRFEEAESAWAQAVSLDSETESPDLLLDLAEVCLINRHDDQAVKALDRFPLDRGEPGDRATYHLLRVFAAASRGEREACRRDVSCFVAFWSTVERDIEVTWNFDDLIETAGRLPEWGRSAAREMCQVLGDTRALSAFALAHGENEGVERVLKDLTQTGQTGLQLLESGLVSSLADVRLHAARKVAVEAFFDAVGQRYAELEEGARQAADIVLLEAITAGGAVEKLQALRAAGGHLLDFSEKQRGQVVLAMLERAEDETETTEVRNLALRILAIAFYDLEEDQQAEFAKRLRALSATFSPPALVELLTDL